MNDKRIPAAAALADDVANAASNLSVSRAFLYRLIKAGEIESFTVGKRRLVSRDAQRRFVERREAAQ